MIEEYLFEIKSGEKGFNYIDEEYKKKFLELKENFLALLPEHLQGEKRRIYFEKYFNGNVENVLGKPNNDYKKSRTWVLNSGILTHIIEPYSAKSPMLVYDTGYIKSIPKLDGIEKDYGTLKLILSMVQTHETQNESS